MTYEYIFFMQEQDVYYFYQIILDCTDSLLANSDNATRDTEQKLSSRCRDLMDSDKHIFNDQS